MGWIHSVALFPDMIDRLRLITGLLLTFTWLLLNNQRPNIIVHLVHVSLGRCCNVSIGPQNVHIVTPLQQLGLNGRGEKPKFESNSIISDNFFVGSHIRVYRLSLSAKGWVDSYLSLYFRTIALLVIFSQYLSRFDVPLPAFSRDRGCHVIRYPLFRSFPVSMIQCLGYLFRLKENRLRVHRNSPSQFTNNSDFKDLGLTKAN